MKLLDELGRKFRHPARLYLVRTCVETTRDVDVHYEVSPDHHGAFVNALRELKEKLSISIEEAYPGDFVPLPPGSERRCTFIERFGQVDVFLFDPYAVALSKLERDHERDREDVKALLAKRIIEPAELRRLFEAILPAYEAQGVKSDPARFRKALEAALSS